MKKEWKGNSDSVRSRLGINKQHTTKGREVNDFYATDPKALEKLLDGASNFLKGHFNGTIRTYPEADFRFWECACGNGNLANVLDKRGFSCLATDLKDRGCKSKHYVIGKVDFLLQSGYSCEIPLAHIILTNPPYSLANEFIMHALEILPEGGLYIAFMNISYLAGQKRFNQVYQYGTLREVYVFSKRVECWRNNDREKFGKKAMVDFAWFVFQKGYFGQPTLYWL